MRVCKIRQFCFCKIHPVEVPDNIVQGSQDSSEQAGSSSTLEQHLQHQCSIQEASQSGLPCWDGCAASRASGIPVPGLCSTVLCSVDAPKSPLICSQELPTAPAQCVHGKGAHSEWSGPTFLQLSSPAPHSAQSEKNHWDSRKIKRKPGWNCWELAVLYSQAGSLSCAAILHLWVALQSFKSHREMTFEPPGPRSQKGSFPPPCWAAMGTKEVPHCAVIRHLSQSEMEILSGIIIVY